MRTLLTILSSILLIASFPDFNFWPFAWIGLLPLFFALDGQKPLRAFAVAYAAGAIFFLGTIYWLMHVTLPGMIALALYLAVYFGIFGLIASSAVNRPSYLSLLTLPAVWVATEYARAHIFGGFGWNLLAYSQSGNLPMIQIADIGGCYSVSFLIVLVNAAIFFTIKDLRKKKYSTLYPAIALVLVFLAVGYGILRLSNIFTGERLKVAVIQGNIPQDKKWDPEFRKEIIDKYEELTMLSAKEAPDLIIWPETSVPGFLRTERDLYQRVEALAANAHTALLVGDPRQKAGDKDAYYNSATLFGKDGNRLASYDKIHLVPFGEFIPAKGIFSFVEKFTKSTIGDFSAGKEYTVFKFIVERGLKAKEYNWKFVKKVKFSAMICFEDIFPGIARRFVKNGANFLVNITNDAWFGNSCAPYQHLQNSIFRAVENRVNVVRAANSGVSCFIDQKGNVFGHVRSGGKSVFVDGFSVDEIVLTYTRAFYTVYGDIFAYLCILIAALYALQMWITRNNRKDSRMSTNRLIIIVLFSVMAVVSFCAGAYSQEALETNRMESVEGEVTEIDSIKQALVVQWQTSEPDIAYNESTFLIGPSTKIIKGTDEIGFMDINQFDRVTIAYSTDSDLIRNVIRIDVAESD